MMKPNLPPGPKPDPILGNLLAFRRDPLGFYTACAREYGDVARFRIVNVNVYLLSNPELIETVLVENNSNFIKGRVIRSNRSLLGNGLLTSEGDFWRRQRRLSQPAFHRERIAEYANIITQFTDQMMADWQDGDIRDIQLDMKHLTTKVIAKILFDADVTEKADEIGAALIVAREELTVRMRSGLLIPENIPTPGNLRFKHAVDQLDKIVLGIIQRRRASEFSSTDLLSSLLAAQDTDGSQMTDHQLRDEVMTLFAAGHETTALALTWAIFLLSQNSEVMTRLHAEINEVFGTRLPDINDIPCLIYTEMIAKEVLRLYPPSWTIPRQAIHDCEIGGYFVPAGTSITISQWVMHRDPRFFENPTAFIPERWLNNLEKNLPPFVYFPFGGGPRLCIGQSLAMTEMTLVLAMLAKNFNFELLADPPVMPWPSLTIYPRNGIGIKVRRRA
jgi:cytochrome P450